MTVADVQISETNGAGATVTNNITNANMGTTDAVNLVVANFVIVAGNNSYEKWLRIRCNLINDSNKIDNFKFWVTPSTPEIGISYKVNCQEYPSLVNDAYPGGGPVATTSTYADQTAPTSEPTNENVGVSGGQGGLTADNTFSDYIVVQLQSTGASDPGDLLTKTLHFQYDEQ